MLVRVHSPEAEQEPVLSTAIVVATTCAHRWSLKHSARSRPGTIRLPPNLLLRLRQGPADPPYYGVLLASYSYQTRSNILFLLVLLLTVRDLYIERYDESDDVQQWSVKPTFFKAGRSQTSSTEAQQTQLKQAKAAMSLQKKACEKRGDRTKIPCGTL